MTKKEEKQLDVTAKSIVTVVKRIEALHCDQETLRESLAVQLIGESEEVKKVVYHLLSYYEED